MMLGLNVGLRCATGAPQMRAGSLVVLHGENVHYSSPNTSDISRHAYSMHMVEGAQGVAWAPDNW